MGSIVLFGATGYTGRLTADELVARGAKPVLAGRNAASLEQMSTELGGGFETRVADVARPETVKELVSPGDVMLTTVGPFARWGGPAVEAAIDTGVPYIDSTGEASFIREVFDGYGPRAAATGAPLMTAMGYDWVPGNLAGALAIEQAGERAVRVDVGYFMTGQATSDAMSGGTRASAAGVMLAPGFSWQQGRIVTERSGKRVRSFVFRGSQRAGVSASTTEHFSLPRLYPQLRDVNVYLGWFGPMSRPMSIMSAGLSAAQKIPGVQAGLEGLLGKFVKGSTGGPGVESRAKTGSEFIAIAYDVTGSPLTEVRVEGPNGYDFTARMLAWSAIEALAGNVSGSGALGPAEAFGVEGLRLGLEACGCTVVQSSDEAQLQRA